MSENSIAKKISDMFINIPNHIPDRNKHIYYSILIGAYLGLASYLFFLGLFNEPASVVQNEFNFCSCSLRLSLGVFYL